MNASSESSLGLIRWVGAAEPDKTGAICERYYAHWIPAFAGMTSLTSNERPVVPTPISVIPRPTLSSLGPLCYPAAHSVIPRPTLSSRGPLCHPAAHSVIPRLDRGIH